MVMVLETCGGARHAVGRPLSSLAGGL